MIVTQENYIKICLKIGKYLKESIRYFLFSKRTLWLLLATQNLLPVSQKYCNEYV